MTTKLLAVFIALAVGNFVYQTFGGYDWHAAIERSFFQAVAILIVGVMLRGDKHVS